MTEDKEITRQVWDGKIPIAFNLAQDEVTTPEPPVTYYVLAPRCSYLTLVTDAVQRHFVNSIPEPPDTEDEIWFDYEGIPLRWHWPIGVLFDLFGSTSKLPWNLTVHFQSYPDDEILHCQDKEVIENHLINTLKEADCLKNGSAKKTLNLLKKDLKQLWEGMKTGRYEQYWAVNKRLMQRDDGQPSKYIPFRLYVKQEPVLMDPISPVADDGRQKTLGDLLTEVRPDLFPPREKPRAKAVVHGVVPSLETPVQWLSDNCSHPDNFLHIVLQLTDDSYIAEEHD